MSPLKERIAQALGWTVEQTHTFSLQALRDILRPVSPKLANELSEVIQSGSYITDNQPKKRRP